MGTNEKLIAGLRKKKLDGFTVFMVLGALLIGILFFGYLGGYKLYLALGSNIWFESVQGKLVRKYPDQPDPAGQKKRRRPKMLVRYEREGRVFSGEGTGYAPDIAFHQNNLGDQVTIFVDPIIPKLFTSTKKHNPLKAIGALLFGLLALIWGVNGVRGVLSGELLEGDNWGGNYLVPFKDLDKQDQELFNHQCPPNGAKLYFVDVLRPGRHTIIPAGIIAITGLAGASLLAVFLFAVGRFLPDKNWAGIAALAVFAVIGLVLLYIAWEQFMRIRNWKRSYFAKNNLLREGYLLLPQKLMYRFGGHDLVMAVPYGDINRVEVWRAFPRATSSLCPQVRVYCGDQTCYINPEQKYADTEVFAKDLAKRAGAGYKEVGAR